MVPVFNGPIFKRILPDICSLLPVPNFPNMIYPTETVSPSQPVAYSLPRPFFSVRFKSAYKRVIVLRSAKVSQSESFVWFLNWAAFFCTCPLYGSQHAYQYSRIGRTDICSRISFFQNKHYKVKCLPGFFRCVIYLVHPV